ncbi:glycosyltransferase family 4 protein [Mycobacterium yunnanensis]|uniref:Glycosyltransferase family 4 protein n=1 Tax=Mycobacterium yunnanensis TaxID=368477 RepID=A0A9X2Z3H6_9MYCO|nr:glycosyltransferase family 4 protein [Mycobacterium yunnanensis]MCV7421959.1 glycosyltransferase family 4 protein [Mycobacterium yunnanensis]
MTLHPRIALFSVNYPPEPTGVAPYAGALAAGLKRLGFGVTARVAQPHYPQWAHYKGYGQWTLSENLDGIDVHRHRHYVPRHPHGIRRLLSEVSFGLRLVSSKWRDSDAVVAVSPALFATALVALRMRVARRDTPFIVWVQDLYALGMAETGEGAGMAGAITRWVESRTLRAADRVAVIHPRFQRHAVDELGIDPKKIVVVRNWAHLPASALVDAALAKEVLGWPSDVMLAVHTGNLGVKQGLENVVDAARLADELDAPVHFILVGDGCERDKLTARARGVERLSFVDPLSDAEYPRALCAADVLVVNEMPGVTAMAVPSKLTSYFHAGRPVVAATDPNGVTAEEIALSGAGMVVPAGDPKALLDALLKIGTDAEAAAHFGASGQLYRQAVLSERAAIGRWATLIEDVLIRMPSSSADRSLRAVGAVVVGGLIALLPFTHHHPSS